MRPRTPLTPDQRAVLSSLSRERPNATPNQLARIFQARTGRAIGWETASRAKAGHFDRPTDRYHLAPGERAILRTLIDEAAPDYSWAEIARTFAALTGRPINYQSVANAARKMGVTARIRSGARPGVERATVERAVEAARAAKLEDAPYRPGYFPKAYRGDGGGECARVYKAVGPSGGVAEGVAS